MKDLKYYLGLLETDNKELEKAKQLNNQIQIAKEVLNVVRTYLDSTAIIAGGAPRNWVLGELANDLDVYLHIPNKLYENQHDLKNACKLINNAFGNKLISCYENKLKFIQVLEPSQDKQKYLASSIIDSVLEYKYKDNKVQFIFLKTEDERWEVLKNFKVSSSEVYFDGNTIKGTYNFNDFVNRRFITIDSKYCNSKYLDKLKTYYPNPEYEYQIRDYVGSCLCSVKYM